MIIQNPPQTQYDHITVLKLTDISTLIRNVLRHPGNFQSLFIPTNNLLCHIFTQKITHFNYHNKIFHASISCETIKPLTDGEDIHNSTIDNKDCVLNSKCPDMTV